MTILQEGEAREDATSGGRDSEAQPGACTIPPQEGWLLLDCINEMCPNLQVSSPLSLAGDEGLQEVSLLLFSLGSCPQKMPSPQKLPLPGESKLHTQELTNL